MKIYKLPAALFLLAISGTVLANDIDLTPWSMYQQNAAHTGFIDATLNPKTFKFDWKIPVGEEATPGLNYSIPGAVVAGNLVYVSRHNYAYSNTLQAFSIKDGHEIWKKSYGEVGINPPAIYKNKVIIQTVNNFSPETAIYAYDAKTGKILFKTPTSAQWDEYLSPTIFDDHIYADGGSDGGMYSFQGETGKQDWFTGLAQYDMWTPAVDKQYAIAYTGGQLNVLDRITGKTVVNITDPHFQWMGYSTNFAPVLLGNNQVVGIQSGYLTLYNIDKKNITWSDGPGYIGQPTYDNQYIYASQNDGLVVLNKNNKTILWKWFTDNERVGGQIIATKNLIFITTEQKVYAISKKTHEAVWSYPASGALSLGMGHLYIMEHSGNLTSISVSA